MDPYCIFPMTKMSRQIQCVMRVACGLVTTSKYAARMRDATIING